MNRRFAAPLAAVLLAAALALTGCDALDQEVYSDLTPETFFQSEGDFRAANAVLYNAFIADWGTLDTGAGTWYASLYNADPKTYLARSMTTTDELYSPWSTTMDCFEWGPAGLDGPEEPTYAKIRYVARATDIIDKIQSSPADVPDDVRAAYVAEARALRGWLMFALYDFFGPVNVKLDPATLADEAITPRPSRAEYVAAMEADLLAALPNLPDRFNGDAQNWGRVSKGTVRMVLLRLYMHEKDWAKAEAVARELMGMGYGILPSYADVFNVEQNNEVIHAIPAGEPSPNYWVQEVLPANFASAERPDVARGPGWYGYWMPWEFYDTFEAGDARLGTIAESYVNARGEVRSRTTSPALQGAIPFKYTAIQGDGPGYALDVVVFRYAEVLLSLAEALNEQGRTGEALDLANEVRARAGVAAWSGLSQGELRDALLAERGRELYAEGVRRQDLIRHGKYIEYAQRLACSQAQPHHVLFPIPFSVVLQGDGVIEQNPGY